VKTPIKDAAREAERIRPMVARLRERRTERALTRAFNRILDSTPSPGSALAWLAARDPDDDVAGVASELLRQGLANHETEEDEDDRLAEAALAVVRDALESPDVSTVRKHRLGALLDGCGVDPFEEPGFLAVLASEEGQDEMPREIAQHLAGKPEGIDLLLQQIELDGGDDEDGVDSLDFPRAIARALQPLDPAGAARLGATLAVAAGEAGLADLARTLVEDLAEQASSEALWCLEELARWPGLEALREAARGTAVEVALSHGLRPQWDPPRPFSHGVTTCIDGRGSRSAYLFYNTPEGEMDVVGILTNDGEGLLDAWAAYGEGVDISEDIRTTMEANGLPYAFCSPEFARRLLADAVAQHEEQNTPLPSAFFLVRPRLGGDPIEPARLVPDLSAYDLENLERTPDLFESNAEDLVEDVAELGLGFASDDAYAFVKQHQPKRGGNIGKKAQERFARTVAVLDRDVLLARLAGNLEIEALAGRAQFEENQALAATWLGLKEDVVPWHEVPFIKELVGISTQHILANVRRGFDTQREANEADDPCDEDSWDPDDDEDWLP